MKLCCRIACLCFSIILSANGEETSSTLATSTISPSQMISRAHFEFALELYDIMAKANNETSETNVLFSPYSVSSVLAMVYLGAAGNTSDELRSALKLQELTYPDIHRAYKKIVTSLNMESVKLNLTTANGVFVDRDFNISQKYAGILHDYYNATLQEVDFRGGGNDVQTMLNSWVANKTRGKITDLIDAPLNPDTRLILLNALHLKGFWLHQFDSRLTAERGTFHVSKSRRVHVPMMQGKFRVPLGRSDKLHCSVLELPYVGRRLSMFIVLPDSVDGLSELEDKLNLDSLRQLLATIRDDQDIAVNIRLPRFKIEARTSLKDALVDLGVGDLFQEGTANLSGMAPDHPEIFISSIVHRAILEVTEEGSEAAAASVVGVQRIGTVEEPYFEVDHPFMFFVWDYQTSVVLFMGRLVQPDDS